MKVNLLLLPLFFYASSALADQTEQNVNFNDLAKQCAPTVHANTLQAIARTESGFNPYAIGVVKGQVKQPTNFEEAVATAKSLAAQGKNFSMGLSQVNRYNLDKYGLDYQTVFDPCKNLQAGSAILKDCFDRADGSSQEALQKALSCYYSGNFRTGFSQDFAGLPSYVDRIKIAALANKEDQTVITKVAENTGDTKQIPAIDPQAAAPVIIKKVKAKNRVKTVAVNMAKSESTNTPKSTWDAFGDWKQ